MSYKKKRGRKKKKGPKKKIQKKEHVYVGLKRPYHIITSNNGIQLKDIHTCVSIESAIKKMKEIQESYNKDIRFPVKYISNRNEKTFTEADYKLILIKKRDTYDTFVGKVKNEYGKYIDCVTNNDKWVFIDELPYFVEETFWVYGYNPKRQRKTFKFIFDNLILPNSNEKYHIKQIVVFRNKLLISTTNKLDMVICKNHQDSVRLYNELSIECTHKKIKNITFCGDIISKTISFQIWYDKIKKLTNWSYRKINKNSTRD